MTRTLLIVLTLTVGLMLHPATFAHAGVAARSGDFITSGYLGNSDQVGSLTEFKGVDLKFAADGTPDDKSPLFPDRPWLFELDNLTAANKGQTWITDETNPNFAAFETIMTDGVDDFVFARWFPHAPAGGVSEIGLSTYYFLHGLDAPEPGPGDQVDLQGYDLTEVHLTLEEFVYGSAELFPGVVAWGYQYTIRVDFYGDVIPAPGAALLLVFGAPALLGRRRRPIIAASGTGRPNPALTCQQSP